MKKIFVLLMFFFFIPIINAETYDNYHLINIDDTVKIGKIDFWRFDVHKFDEEVEETNWGSIENTNLETICGKPEFRKPLKFIGTLVTILKIAIPILIIVFGIVDLFKAIPSSKDDRIMIAVKSIGIRFVAGVFIFFIPGIVQLILDWVNEWSNFNNTWCCCTQCILDSGNCDVNSCNSSSCKIGGMN